jgi:hypothetical protein
VWKGFPNCHPQALKISRAENPARLWRHIRVSGHCGIAVQYTFRVLRATDLTDGSAVPYFLWDESLSLDELRRRLAGDDEEERVRLTAKVMREARFDEAVGLVPVAEIVADYPRLRRNLGRRLAFWDFLIAEWRSLGLVP